MFGCDRTLPLVAVTGTGKPRQRENKSLTLDGHKLSIWTVPFVGFRPVYFGLDKVFAMFIINA